MSTKTGYSTDKGLIAMPEYQTLIYAWGVTITVSGSAVEVPQDTCSLTHLAALATQSANQPSHVISWVKLQSSSPALITPSIFLRNVSRVTLLMRALIGLSGQSPTYDQIAGRRAMLALPRVIAFAGCTATTHRIRVLNYSVLNTSLGAGWQEPPPYSIVNRKTTGTFSPNWAIPMDGYIRYGNPESEQMSE